MDGQYHWLPHFLLTCPSCVEEFKNVTKTTCERSPFSERSGPFGNDIEGRFTVSGPASEIALQQASLTMLSTLGALESTSFVAQANSHELHYTEVYQSSSQVDGQGLSQGNHSVLGKPSAFLSCCCFYSLQTKHSTVLSLEEVLVEVMQISLLIWEHCTVHRCLGFMEQKH